MDNKDQNIEDLVYVLVKGSITKEGLSQLESWTHQSEENRCYVRDLREMFFLQKVLNNHMNYNVKAAMMRFHQHLIKSESDQIIQSVVPVSTIWKRLINSSIIIRLKFFLAFIISGRCLMLNKRKEKMQRGPSEVDKFPASITDILNCIYKNLRYSKITQL